MEKLRKDIPKQFKWNLDVMFKDPQEYEDACAEISLLINKIVAMKGNIAASSDNLVCYLKTNDLLNQKLSKLYVYSYLYYHQDMHDEIGLSYKNKADKIAEQANLQLSFANSELLKIGYAKIKDYMVENEDLREYAFFLEEIFRYDNHVLSEKEEKIIAEANNAFGTGHDSFSALDNIDINLGYIFDEDGNRVILNNSNYIKYMNSSKRSVRKQAFKKMYAFFKNHINTISAMYLGCIKEDYFSSNVRGFSSPLEQSLFADNIPVDFYSNFITEVHKYLPLSYRYMKARNKILKIKSHMYDIYVDLGKVENSDIPYDLGKKMVIEALQPLGKPYINDLCKSFTDGWIDVYPNKYKRSGAYEWDCYGNHPYVSLNYENNIDSVSTMAHELGHAMHSYYSNSKQPSIYAGYPIFLAEIASTVNEVLFDDYLYKHAKCDEERIVYLQNFLDKVRTTIFRQTMFAEFEKIMHDKYKNGIAVTASELCQTYYDLNKLYFGSNVVIDEDIKYEWARIPHFYTPFYVYKYATGLVSALSIASDILKNGEEACKGYMNFLSSGGSNYPFEILKKANVDITDVNTIKKAFAMFEEKLDLLEKLIAKRDEV